jgi:serine/threonine protein kinase
MPSLQQHTMVCETCGARIETTASGDFGCMVYMLRAGLGEDADRAPDTIQGSLGQYVIVRRDDGTVWELGSGAMGVTYLARDTALQRPVALKIIKTEFAGRATEARGRFMREARAAGALRHPNVATIYHFGIDEESGQSFYAMELVEGETLEQQVRRSGPLDVRATLEIACQITVALIAAEKCGLVHRDLKPANAMIAGREESEVLLVKVIDFGLAKALVETPDSRTLTHSGFIGTPAFASPEQFSKPSLYKL